MRIVGKTHDYYDGCLAYGQDSDILYVREKKDIELTNLNFIPSPSPRSYNAWKYSEDYRVKPGVIWFCGKLYGFFSCPQWNDGHQDRLKGSDYYYTIESLDTYFNQHKENDQTRIGYEKYHRNWYRKWLADVHDVNSDMLSELAVKHRSPVIGLRTEWNHESRKNAHYAQLNANLKEIQFFKVFDPQQTYQEISMFMGNMAYPDTKIPAIDDKTMAEIKGFNKFSFRKDKRK